MRKGLLLAVLISILMVWGCTEDITAPTTITPVNKINEILTPKYYMDADSNLMVNTDEHAKMAIATGDTLKAVVATSVELAYTCTNVDEDVDIFVDENAAEAFNDTTWIWYNYADDARMELSEWNDGSAIQYRLYGFEGNMNVLRKEITGTLPTTIDRVWDCYPNGIYKYTLTQDDNSTVLTTILKSTDLGIEDTITTLDYTNIDNNLEVYMLYPEVLLDSAGVDSAVVYHMVYIKQSQAEGDDGMEQTGISEAWFYDGTTPDFPSDSTGYDVWVNWSADGTGSWADKDGNDGVFPTVE